MKTVFLNLTRSLQMMKGDAITSLCERAYGPKDAEITWGYETALVGEYGRRIGKRYQKLPSDPLECVMEQYRGLLPKQLFSNPIECVIEQASSAIWLGIHR